MKTGKHLVDEINSFAPADERLGFWWFGQLGYAIRAGGRTLYFDLYLRDAGDRLIPPLCRPEEVTGADLFFGSHHHSDHIDTAVWGALHRASPAAKFVVPRMFAAELSETLGIPADCFIGMNAEETAEVNGVKITAIAAAHEFFERDEETGLFPHLGFLVEAGGFCIYHSGDCCKYEGLETRLKQAGAIDLMMLPINGRDGKRYREGCIGNMDFREAVDLAGAVSPRLAVPGHYEMFSNNSENPMLFMDFMEAKYPGQAFWIGGHGVCTTLSREGEVR